MPIIKSAIKRVRQTETRRKRNLITKDRYRSLVKEFTELVAKGQEAAAAKLFPQMQKAIDMAVKKNMLNANTAGRMKSKLSKALPQKAAAPKAKATTEKAPAKKVAPKKPAAKKPAAKKAE